VQCRSQRKQCERSKTEVGLRGHQGSF
jgi:hypothetical protein